MNCSSARMKQDGFWSASSSCYSANCSSCKCPFNSSREFSRRSSSTSWNDGCSRGWCWLRAHLWVAYLAAGPDKPALSQSETVLKKRSDFGDHRSHESHEWNPAPKDGVVTEILVSNEEMVEFGKGLVRINDRYSRNQRSSTPSLPHAPSGPCLGSEQDTIVAIKKCDHQRTFLQWSFSSIPSHARCSYHGSLGPRLLVSWNCPNLKIKRN